MIKVKICGLTRVEDVVFSSDAGASAVGMVYNFPSSPRNLTPQNLKRLGKVVPPLTQPVLVTNEGGLRDAFALGFQRVQLVTPPERLSLLKEEWPELRITPVLAIGQGFDFSILRVYSEFDSVVADTALAPGGSGKTHDWGVTRRVARELGRVVLAGGLNPDNVADAICAVDPYAVDVSSGVEASPGVKDHNKVLAFIRRVVELG